MLRRLTHREDGSGHSKGQSLVEFAIILPVFLLIIGGALDLGRLFYAQVAIENAAKEGALYGAIDPRCDAPKEGCSNPNTVSWLVANESVGIPNANHSISCSSGSVNDCEAGDTYTVTVTSTFTMVTPILTPLLGNSLLLKSIATSRVGTDAFDPDAPIIPGPPPTPVPTSTPAPTGSPDPSQTPGTSPPPGATPTPTPAPTATPDAQCTVPNLIGVKLNEAEDMWSNAGFTGAFVRPNGNSDVRTQSHAAGTSLPCTSSITVTK